MRSMTDEGSRAERDGFEPSKTNSRRRGADRFKAVSLRSTPLIRPAPLATFPPQGGKERYAATPRQSARLAKYTPPDSAVIQKLTGQSE